MIVPQRINLFAVGLGLSLLVVFLSQWATPSFAGIVSVVLAALAIVPATRALFARHREAAWAAEGDVAVAARATIPLVENIFWLLLGVTAAYAVAAFRLDAATRNLVFVAQSTALVGGDIPATETFFASAVVANILLSALAFAAAALLREIGVALVIAWTGSYWGVGLVTYHASHGSDTVGALLGFFSILTICPALIGAAAAGLFLARGAVKYRFASPAWKNILRTSLRILAAVVLFAFLAAGFTALTQARLLFGALLGMI